jgi:hypothetical protein
MILGLVFISISFALMVDLFFPLIMEFIPNFEITQNGDVRNLATFFEGLYVLE